MLAAIASLNSPDAAFGGFARAVAPVDAAPHAAQPQPQPSAAPAYAGSAVALAPAAMSVLIEAQERLAQDAAPLDRARTAQRIDHILTRLDAAAGPAEPGGAASFAARRLERAREALSPARLDLQA